jgi:hypothetical protein
VQEARANLDLIAEQHPDKLGTCKERKHPASSAVSTTVGKI